MESKEALANKLLLRHISQHKILKSPYPSYYHTSDSKTPIWSNPPILEKYLLKAFTNCLQTKPMFELTAINKEMQSRHSLSSRKAITQFTGRQRTLSNQKRLMHSPFGNAYSHRTIDPGETIPSIRNVTPTPFVNIIDFQSPFQYLTQKWGMNVKKAAVMYVERSVSTARPRKEPVRALFQMNARLRDMNHSSLAKFRLKPAVFMKKKPLFGRPFTCKKEEESPLCGW